MPEPVRMLVSLPPTLSAIKVGEDEMRVQISIPRTEWDRARVFYDLHGEVFVLSVEREADAIRNGTHPLSR